MAMEYSSKPEPEPVTGFPICKPGPEYCETPPAALEVGPVPWSTGLYDCREDSALCWFTCICPCVTFARIAEIVDKGDSSTCWISGCWYFLIQYNTCLQCLCTKVYRTKMRKQYNLEESPQSDCCVHFCNEPCALCQEYKELEHRGFDMTAGYKANMERKRLELAAATSPPETQGEMER